MRSAIADGEPRAGTPALAVYCSFSEAQDGFLGGAAHADLTRFNVMAVDGPR